jgi:hypothetical protein
MSEQWFAVRQVFQERITLWEAASFEDAIAKAEQDGAAYVEGDEDVLLLGLAQAHWLFEAPASGREVFSLMRESELHPKDYLDAFFDTGHERQGHIPADE